MATTTAAAIRDRAIAVIKTLTALTVPNDTFVAYRNELGADFRSWANANAQASVRRFQVRTSGADREIEVTDEQLETHYLELEIIVAYPQTHRWGADNALDRDDAMEQDLHLILDAIGVRGSENFTPPHADATWREHLNVDDEHERGAVCDFLVIKQLMSYTRLVATIAKDATSGKYVPGTQGQWGNLLAGAGLSHRVPSFAWGFQDTSGDAAPLFGPATLLAQDTPLYQQTVNGWTRKACGWSDGGSDRFGNFSDIPNLLTNSFAILGYIYTTGVPAAQREVLGMGSGTASEIRVTTGGVYRIMNAAGATSDGVVAYGGNVRPLLMVYNRALSTLTLYTDSEIVSVAYGDISGGGLWFGGQTTLAPNGGVLYGAAWTGVPAELTQAEARGVLQALNWTVAW